MPEASTPRLFDDSPATPSLQELLAMAEELSGLEASVYPPRSGEGSRAIELLPAQYRRHMSPFCRLIKGGRDGMGCRGHDSHDTTRRAEQEGHPFVQVCRAGVAEVIVPVYHGQQYLGAVFLGQARTEAVEAGGFPHVWKAVAGAGINRRRLRAAYEALPTIPEAQLLRLGQFLNAAIRGIAGDLSEAAFVREVRLQHAPAVRRALDILAQERDYAVAEKAMAARVHLSVSHFSRLFRRVMDQSYSDYVTALRIREAQNLLHQTDTPISDIARRCGFGRQSYFSRRFKLMTGMTPTQYRHQRTHPQKRGHPKRG